MFRQGEGADKDKGEQDEGRRVWNSEGKRRMMSGCSDKKKTDKQNVIGLVLSSPLYKQILAVFEDSAACAWLLFLRLFVCLSVRQSVRQSLYLSACLSGRTSVIIRQDLPKPRR